MTIPLRYHFLANTLYFGYKNRKYIKYSAAGALAKHTYNYYNSDSNGNNMAPIPRKRKHQHKAPFKTSKRVKHKHNFVKKHKKKILKIRKSRHVKTGGQEGSASELIDNSIHGVFHRSHTNVLIKHPMKRPNHGAWKYMDQFFQQVGGGEGCQGVNMLGNFGFSGDLVYLNAPSVNPANSNYSTKQLMFDLNPYQKLSGGNYYVAGQIPSNDFIFLDNIKLHYEIANLNTTAVAMDIYVVLAKTNGNGYCVDDWTNFLAAQALAPDTSAALGASYNVAGTVFTQAAEGQPTTSLLGEKPYMCTAWNKKWQILAMKSFDFAADTNVSWDLNISVNKRISKAYLNQVNSTFGAGAPYVYYKGLTVQVFAVTRGQVIADIQAASGLRQPTIGSTGLGVVCSRYYHCSTSNPNRLVNETAIPYLLTGAPIAKQVQISVTDNAQVVQAAE